MTMTILITGASSGIGEGLAREYAKRGARLALVARRIERLEALAADLRAVGAEVSVHQGDVTREGDIARIVKEFTVRGIAIDLVYANAGFGVAGPLPRLHLDDYRRQFETNVFGLLQTIYETLDALRASRGRLVLVGSVAGHVAAPSASAYAMSKFSVRAQSESLRGDLQRDGIGVTLVSPGFVDSDIRRTDNQGQLQEDAPDPVPAWLRVPTDVAVREIVRGVERGKAEIVVTGHGKIIVFLSRHFPRLVRFLLLRSYTGRPEPKSAKRIASEAQSGSDQ
ncbi:MAG: SDR family NAD(P)-dependent oxidoreductase [Steroidobacteraceae bacterium]